MPIMCRDGNSISELLFICQDGDSISIKVKRKGLLTMKISYLRLKIH